MSLTLLVETSSIEYGVALGEGDQILGRQSMRRDAPGFVSIGDLARSCLAAAGAEFSDIELLAVNVGPGGLSSVRAGVSYTNGLAFSLGRPVLSADALTLTALAAEPGGGLPLLCLRTAGGGDAFAGLFRNGVAERMRLGPLAEVVPELAGDLSEVALAGRLRPEAARLLPSTSVKDTGLEYPDVSALHTFVLTRRDDDSALAPYASPLSESSKIFGG